jgi:guanylate kinase
MRTQELYCQGKLGDVSVTKWTVLEQGMDAGDSLSAPHDPLKDLIVMDRAKEGLKISDVLVEILGVEALPYPHKTEISGDRDGIFWDSPSRMCHKIWSWSGKNTNEKKKRKEKKRNYFSFFLLAIFYPTTKKRKNPPPKMFRKHIVITGVHGSYKSATAGSILNSFPDEYHMAVSHTTRKPISEEDDCFHFISVPEFLEMKKRGEFFEDTQIGEDLYGLSKEEFSNFRKKNEDGETSSICIMNCSGVVKLKEELKDNLLVIKTKSPNKDLIRRRMSQRGYKEEEIDMIMKIDEEEEEEIERLSTMVDFKISDVEIFGIASEVCEFIKHNSWVYVEDGEVKE